MNTDQQSPQQTSGASQDMSGVPAPSSVPTPSSAPQGYASFKELSSSVKQKVQELPSKMGGAIEDGRGTELFEVLSSGVNTVLGAISNSCRYIVAAIYMMSKKDKKTVSHNIFALSIVFTCVLFCFLVLLQGDISNLILCLEFPCAAILADGLLQGCRIQTQQTQHQAEQSTIATQVNNQADDDYL